MNLPQATVDGALIGAATAVIGFVVALGGNLLIESAKDRRRSRRERDQAIAELLTSAVDLITGVQAIRAAYHGHGGWRERIQRAATILTAIGAVLPGEPGSPALRSAGDWQELLDWRLASPILDRLLTAIRDLDDRQRTTALDLAAVVLPRTIRFYSAVAALTLGRDKNISSAARELSPAVAGLLDVIAAEDRTYQRARRRAEKALGGFRTIADERRR